MQLLRLAAAVLALAGLPAPAGAQPTGQHRVALVVGNTRYEEAPLKNPENDARDMAAALGAMGFEVILATDANLAVMKQKIREFGQRLRSTQGVGLFFFSGHGMQVKGENYLIPIGAKLTVETEAEYETVNAGFVLAQMEAAGNPLNIVILDACRNNPFARSFRSAERGLAQVTAPTGTLIAYATAPGSVASDGSGRNGAYTAELLRFMRVPGLPVEEVFKQVRIAVRQSSQGSQVPWEASSLVGNFSFVGGPAPAPVYSAGTQPVASPEPRPTTPPPASPPPATVASGASAASVTEQARQLAAAGQLAEAKRLVEQGLAANPGHPDLLDVKWLVHLALKEWRDAAAAGEELERRNPARADTLYFDRLTAAYLADSQTTKAVDAVERGVARFPDNRSLAALHPAVLNAAGRPQAAIPAARRAMRLGADGAYAQLVRAYASVGHDDSLLAVLREAPRDTGSLSLASMFALQHGNDAYKACSASKSQSDCGKALTWLALSDTLKASPDAKFLLGVAAFTYGAQKIQDARKTQSCGDARAGRAMIRLAALNIPAGAAKFPDNAKAIMDYLAQLGPLADQYGKAYCK